MKSNISRITGGALAAGLLVGVSACVQLFDHSHDIKVRPIVDVQGSNTSVDSEYYLSAVAAIKGRDYATALEYLQAARAKDPQSIRVLNAFGVVYDKLGRFDLSARYYAEASALDPKSAIVAKNMSYSKSLQGLTAPDVSQLASNQPSTPVVARAEVPASAISQPAESPAPTPRIPQLASSQPPKVSMKLAATEPRLIDSSPPAINASATPVSKMASSNSEPVPMTKVLNIQPTPAPRPPVNVTSVTPKSQAAPSQPQAASVKQASNVLPAPAPQPLASVTPIAPKPQATPSQPAPVKQVSNALPAPSPQPLASVTPMAPKSQAATSQPQPTPVKQVSNALPAPAPKPLASVTQITPKPQPAPSQPQAVPVKQASNVLLAPPAQQLPSAALTQPAPQTASVKPIQSPAKQTLDMQAMLNSPGGLTRMTRHAIPAAIKAAAPPRSATPTIAVQPSLTAVADKTTVRPLPTQQILSAAPTAKAAISGAVAAEHHPPAAVTPVMAAKPAPNKKTPLAKSVLLTGYPLVVTDATGKIDAAQLVRRNLAILGWTISRNTPSPIRSRPVTTLLYPPSSVAAARALARTLPFPAHLTANACNCGLKLVVGSDFSGWKTVQPRNPDPRTKNLSVAAISNNRPVGVR